MAVRLDISAFKRVPFIARVPFVGVDWSSGATFALQIRALPGDTGTALVSLAGASAGSEGVSASYDSAYELPDGTTAAATVLTIQVNEATLEGLSLSARASEPVNLYYDLHVTPSGGTKAVQIFGKFDLYPGVTI